MTIGFDNQVYESSENAVQEVCAEVMAPVQLGRSVVVTLRSMDGTAQGNWHDIFIQGSIA